VSPDGQWVAFTSSGVRESLLVARVDGRQYRRLTDDAFRNRGPSWTPDGAAIGFYSDRGGGYEVWTIRPDGSGLEMLLPSKGGAMNFPVWSPDGARVAAAVIPGNWSLFSLGSGPPEETQMPPPGDRRFWPLSWSPDGRRIAGIVLADDSTIEGIGVYSLDSGRYETGRSGRSVHWLAPLWLGDSRRLLLRDPRGISVVDTATWREKRLVTIGGYMVGRSVSASPGDRFVTWTETATEGDIWLATLQ
jgi:Tol biopolymer transport system component